MARSDRMRGTTVSVQSRRHVATPRPRVLGGRGRPKTQATRSSARSGDSGEDGESSGESSEPPARRLCENERCRADISHLHSLAHYCDGGCKQEGYRDRCTRAVLDEKTGTVTSVLSCVCDPQRNTLEPAHCHQCGKPRGIITRGWVDENGVSARVAVVTRQVGLKRRNPRLGDSRRKPITEYQEAGGGMNATAVHPSAADRLEALARRPLGPHRELLLMLADRLRALEALVQHDRDQRDRDQRELLEAA